LGYLLHKNRFEMRILTRKEAEKLKTKGPGRRSRVRAEIEALEVGVCLLLERSDWTQATRSPKTLVRDIEGKMGREYRCELLIDGSGWLVERLR
jgi:hypothetical protein